MESMEVDVTAREVRIGGHRKRALTPREFDLLVLLAIRSTDGTGGWVEASEISRSLPAWPVARVGKSVGEFVLAKDLTDLIDAVRATAGPFRLRCPVVFVPNRDAAVNHVVGARYLAMTGARQRQFEATELQFFDHVAQDGYYRPAALDFVANAIGDPLRQRQKGVRVMAFKVLGTIAKNRRDFARASDLIDRGLTLARELGEEELVCYFLDQQACIAHMRGDYALAEELFRHEIIHVEALERVHRRHLVRAFRGLSSTLRSLDRPDEARAAIGESESIARETGDAEGIGLAAIEKARLGLISTSEAIAAVPPDHVIGQIMVRVDAALRGDQPVPAQELLRKVAELGLIPVDTVARDGLLHAIARVRDTSGSPIAAFSELPRSRYADVPYAHRSPGQRVRTPPC